MREWMINSAIATNEDIEEIEKSVRQSVKQAQKEAWDEYIEPVKKDVKAISALLKEIGEKDTATSKILQELAGTVDPLYRDVVHAVRRTLAVTAGKEVPAKDRLRSWYQDQKDGIRDRWNSRLFTDSRESALNVPDRKSKRLNSSHSCASSMPSSS